MWVDGTLKNNPGKKKKNAEPLDCVDAGEGQKSGQSLVLHQGRKPWRVRLKFYMELNWRGNYWQTSGREPWLKAPVGWSRWSTGDNRVLFLTGHSDEPDMMILQNKGGTPRRAPCSLSLSPSVSLTHTVFLIPSCGADRLVSENCHFTVLKCGKCGKCHE